mmetsp:Transcript_118809/g.379004  ORF Transcript_118809/g.379004 Transcript_118809/m.379004 type:complete len:200 (+) Transcript_118809:5725-6324(+)
MGRRNWSRCASSPSCSWSSVPTPERRVSCAKRLRRLPSPPCSCSPSPCSTAASTSRTRRGRRRALAGHERCSAVPHRPLWQRHWAPRPYWQPVRAKLLGCPWPRPAPGCPPWSAAVPCSRHRARHPSEEHRPRWPARQRGHASEGSPCRKHGTSLPGCPAHCPAARQERRTRGQDSARGRRSFRTASSAQAGTIRRGKL